MKTEGVSKRRKGVNKLVGEALTITIPRLQKQNQELAKALQDMIENATPSNVPGEYYITDQLLINAKNILKEAGLKQD